MGILNITPDSFSDGGLYQTPAEAVKQLEKMVREGADIIDIGGQSTRPGHTVISPEEELLRVLPVIREAVRHEVLLSIDTFHPSVARAALEAGVHIINDVTGLDNPEMRRLAAEYQAYTVIMHHSAGSTEDVVSFLKMRIEEAVAAGLAKDKIIVDGGIGFGKSFRQDSLLLCEYGRLLSLGVPVMAGVSRKRVVGAACGENCPEERLYGTVALHTMALERGARIIRVHDVKAAVQSAKTIHSILQVRRDSAFGTDYY